MGRRRRVFRDISLAWGGKEAMVWGSMTAATEKRRNELLAVRDTVESIWVAIVLAFVLRAFMIEAFVIPTGSMAPRLLGRHCNLRCGTCGHEYACGLPDDGSSNSTPRTVDAGCPLCGESADGAQALPDGGDRVLVLKYLYHFREPRPWDVVVFRNPQNNRENYIKRLIALPGESIEIIHGDIFVKASGDSPWKIRRKTPRAQRAMWHVLFDNDYRPSKDLIAGGAAPQWEPLPKASWKLENEGRNFAFQGGDEPAELAFRAERWHFYPRYGYNAARVPDKHRFDPKIDTDVDVCTDLKLALVYIPQADDSRVSLSLTTFPNHFKGQVHRDGTVRLWHYSDDRPEKGWRDWGQAGLEPLRIGKGHRIALSHVDFRVRLWVDGKVVLASTDEKYDADHAKVRRPFLQRAMDRLRDRANDVPDQTRGFVQGEIARLEAQLKQRQDDENREIRLKEPHVRVTASGGSCELRHLALYRDVYYTAASLDQDRGGPLLQYGHDIVSNAGKPRQDGRRDAQRWPGIQRLGYVQPYGWGVAPYPITLAKHPDDPDLDEFFVLGDNSPESLDGRSWVSAAPSLRLKDGQGVPQYQLGTVPRYNLIGKAFFVYWPAGFRIPGLEGLPIIPNVGRMRMIR